jgi:hypothetical protein
MREWLALGGRDFHIAIASTMEKKDDEEGTIHDT